MMNITNTQGGVAATKSNNRASAFAVPDYGATGRHPSSQQADYSGQAEIAEKKDVYPQITQMNAESIIKTVLSWFEWVKDKKSLLMIKSHRDDITVVPQSGINI